MQTKNHISLTRKTLYGIMLLGLFFSTFGAGHLPLVSAQGEANDLYTNKKNTLTGIDANIVLEKLLIFYGMNSDSGAFIQPIQDIDSTLFGLFVVPSSENTGPIAHYFVALQNGAEIIVNTEYTESFANSMEMLYVNGLVSQDLLNTFVTDVSAQGDGSSQLSLPWTNNSDATFTNGPHGDGFQPAPNTLSALDLVPNDRQVRAARDGFAQQIVCSGQTQSSWIIVNHTGGWRTSYYHVVNAQVSTVGRQVGRGEYLGDLATTQADALRCGGSWTGAHVHMALLSNGTQVNIVGLDIGGWTVGGSGLSGTMIRISDGAIRYANASSGSRIIHNDGTIGSGGVVNNCNPNADQFALYTDSNYGGSCVIKGVGNYPDPGSMGIANDSVSSLKVGSNVKLTLYGDNNYVSTSETFTNDDSNLSGNTIGDNSASSAKVEPRNSGGTSCNPNADQVALYLDENFTGNCIVKEIGNYPNPGSMGISNDALTSIKVGGNVKLTLCRDDNYSSTCETFTGDDSNLSDNSIGNDQASSAKVESRSNALPSDYGFCAEEGQTCSFSGTAQIYFGANGQFVGPVSKTDGVACSNDVFGDPINGVHKQCFIKGGRPQGSTFCSNEGSTCNFGGGSVATVYFGANGKYSTHTGVVSSTACDTGTFGDPFSGIGKACYYVITGSSISTPSNPNPADNTTFARTSSPVLSWSTNGTSCTVHIWGGSFDISPSTNCGSLALGNQYGGAYNWQVTASNGGSATGPIWHFNVKPYAPTNLTTSGVSATQVTLNWTLSGDDAANIDEYDIYQNGVYIGYVTKGVSTYTATGLDCGSSYSFYVKSKRQGVLSDASNTVSRGVVGCIPAMPSNMTVGSATQSSLTLNWQDNANNETGFKIYRWGYDDAQAQWAFIYLATVGVNLTSYTQTGLVCGSDFNYYEVSAYNANGESSHTGWVQGTTAACPKSELSISSITFSPVSPYTNDDVWAKVVIQNTSNVPTSGFWTDFYIDDTPTGCSDWGSYWGWSDGLAANSTFTWWTRLPASSLTTGAHQFRAYIDSGCEIPETDENNNISSAAFTLTVPPVAPPAHDDFDAARLVSSLPYSDTVDVSGATTASDDPYVPNCDGYELAPGMASVWYKYTPTTNSKLSLDTFGSVYDTYIAVWSGTRGALSSVGCNDDYDHAGGNYQSGLEVLLSANTTYYFEVAEYSDSTTVSSASATSSEPTVVLPPGASSTESASQTRQKSDTEVLSLQEYGKTMKGNSEVVSQAGGTLQFHVRDITSAGADTVGVFRPSKATFYLRNSNTAGAPDITIKMGATTDYPVVGDWDGNGTDTIGVYRNGVFYLSNSNTTGHVDLTFAFGRAGDQPIAGDWNGDGIDTIGIYRSSKITFLLRNSNSAGPPDATFKLGSIGDVGIAGDWNGDGMDSTGVFRPKNGALYFKNANTTGYADIVTVYGIKNDKPVVGDWDGDGDATIGIYRNAQFYLRNTNTRGYADFHVLFGANGDMPLSGNWDGIP